MAKRDSAYYIGRLKKEHPAIYADLRAAKYASVRAASIAAGLVMPSTPLGVLKREWGKASPGQKGAFLAWATASTGSSSATATRAGAPLFDHEGRPLSMTKARIMKIMDRRRIKMGVVMREMGFKPLNQSLALALRCGTRVNLDVQKAVKLWLAANER